MGQGLTCQGLRRMGDYLPPYGGQALLKCGRAGPTSALGVAPLQPDPQMNSPARNSPVSMAPGAVDPGARTQSSEELVHRDPNTQRPLVQRRWRVETLAYRDPP